MILVIAEKPSVAQFIAKVLGVTSRKDGYLEGNNCIVSWCVGHLVIVGKQQGVSALLFLLKMEIKILS